MDVSNLKEFRYNGARSMVLLHEKYLKSFLQTWRKAKSLNLILPNTEDADYKSLDVLLEHIYRASRGYMIWMCDKLNLPDPGIKLEPKSDVIEKEADEYLEYLVEKWKTPLSEIDEAKFHSPTYPSRWGVDYCIDAMLEHAVMHPIRHEFQLMNLIKVQQSRAEAI